MAPDTSIRLILDCDPGVDDALALLLAAASPEFDLLGVTCVAGNRPVETAALNACKVLDLAGRTDVPVHAGAARPLARRQPRVNLLHGADGLGGLGLEARREPSPVHAVDFIEQQLCGAPDRITLAAVGPLTNLALAEIKRPGLLRRARQVLVMGGAAFSPGNVTPAAEFNFHADALAASTVLSSGADVILFGLDVTRRLALGPDRVASLAALGNRCGRAAAAMLRGFARATPAPHDVCPLAWMLAPQCFEVARCLVAVDSRPGLTEGYLWARRLPAEGPPEAALAEGPPEAAPAEGPPDAAPAGVCTGIDSGTVIALLEARLRSLP